MAAPYVPSLGGTTTLIPTGPAPSFGAGLWGDLEGLVTGFVPSIKTAFGAGIHDIGQNIHGHSTGLLFTKHPGGQIASKVIVPQIQAWEPFIHDPIGEIKRGHIVNPILAGLTIASLGLGRLAAVGLTPKELGAAARTRAALSGRYEGPIREITVEMPSGKIQVLKTTPRSGYRTGKALVVEAGKWKVFGETGIKVGQRTVGGRFGTYARGAKAERKADRKSTRLNSSH